MCERRKKDTLVVVSPQNKGLFWDAESHDGKKKEKTVGSKSPKKLVFSPVLEKDFVLLIRFLVHEEKCRMNFECKWCKME